MNEQVLERAALEEPLYHAAEPAVVQRERRRRSQEPTEVLPGLHVQQLAARRQAEPAAREAEGLPVLVLRCVCTALRGQTLSAIFIRLPMLLCILPHLVA